MSVYLLTINIVQPKTILTMNEILCFFTGTLLFMISGRLTIAGLTHNNHKLKTIGFCNFGISVILIVVGVCTML